MNIRDLAYFAAVAEHRHFGRAANSVHISQPTLSMQLKKLEEELDSPLFERLGKETRISKFGEKILPLAKNILACEQEVYQLARREKNNDSGELQIGIFPTLAPYLLPLLIPALKNKYPNLILVIQEKKTLELLKDLKSGQLDFAIMANPIKDESLDSEILFEEAFYLAVPKHHTYANQKSITQTKLQNLELLLLEDGHCFREQALEICAINKAKPKSDLSATSIETLRSLVAAGLGVTLIPQLAVNQSSTEITYLPITNPTPKRVISLYSRRTFGNQKFLADLTILIKKDLSNRIYTRQH